jgi:hypothetical protein
MVRGCAVKELNVPTSGDQIFAMIKTILLVGFLSAGVGCMQAASAGACKPDDVVTITGQIISVSEPLNKGEWMIEVDDATTGACAIESVFFGKGETVPDSCKSESQITVTGTVQETWTSQGGEEIYALQEPTAVSCKP